jgi:hypothetical protein
LSSRALRPAGALVCALAALAATGVRAETVVVDGVPHVRNAAAPAKGQRTVALRESWRAGGEDDEIFFGLVSGAIADDAGNVYILDRQLSQVQVYSPAGEHVRTLSREGDGPGESRQPSDLVQLESGDIGIVQSFPGKVVGIKLDGTPSAGVVPGGDAPTEGGFFMVTQAECRGGNFVLSGARITRQNEGMKRTQFLASCEASGALPVTYTEKVAGDLMATRKYFEKEEYFPGRAGWAVGPDGSVYLAPAFDRYVIERFAPDGKPARVIERPFNPRRRTDEDKRRLSTGIRVRANNQDIPIEGVFDDFDPCIRALHVRQDGSLWVLTSRGERDQPAGILRAYDVFDAEGNFVEQVSLAAPGDDRDGVIWLRDDRLLVVKGLEDAARAFRGENDESGAEGGNPEPLSVICYKLDG